jgi:hypothetical protein
MGRGIEVGVARNIAVWHSEPTFRGTYSLLSTCLITMALCVWTAVHLNLPEHKKTKMQMWRKLWWLVLGLFAPEMVAWTAFEQNREARTLTRKMKEALGETPPHSCLQRFWSWICTSWRTKPAPDLEVIAEGQIQMPRKHAWTMIHSYFAVMGGFAFDSEVIKDELLPDGRKRVALTSLGVLRLGAAIPHLLPDLSVSQIKDKSKANSLTKTVICLQASWFVAQCIARMASRLSISLLELNTFAHAICTLLAYFLWWDKPLDVEEPILIEGLHVATACAGMIMRSSMGLNCIGADFLPGKQIVARLWFEKDGYAEKHTNFEFGLVEALISHVPSEYPVYSKVDSAMEETNRPPVINRHAYRSATSPEHAWTESASAVPTDGNTYRLYMGNSLYGFAFRRGRYHHFNLAPITGQLGRIFTTRTALLSSKVQDQGFKALRLPFIELASADITRLRLAKECFQKYPGLLHYPEFKNYDKSYSNHPNQTHQIWSNEYVAPRVRNWPHSDGSCNEVDTDGMPILLAFLFAGVAYGGLHLLAWDPPVATSTEVLMWRISGITLAVFGAAPILGLLVLMSAFYLDEWINEMTFLNDFFKAIKVKAKWLDYIIQGVIFGIVATAGLVFYAAGIGGSLLYLFSRIYLLVECIISVPYLPDSAFQTTKWSMYFPHWS